MPINTDAIDLLLVLPAIALFLTSLLPLTLKLIRGNQEPPRGVVLTIVMVGLAWAAGLNWATVGIHKYAFAKAAVFDPLTSFSVFLILLITAGALVFVRDHVNTYGNQLSEFIFLLLNAALGMLIVIVSNDLMLMFIGIELMSLCLYILIAMSDERTFSKEAAFKYFVLGSLASAIFIFGTALVYGSVASVSLTEIQKISVDLLNINRLAILGFLFVCVGLMFKVAAFPFNLWVPDVYEGSPTPVTAFMAAGVKVAVITAFLRFVATDFLLASKAELFVMGLQWIAVLTMVLGAVAALFQDNLKRLLAYSGVSHSGYALSVLTIAARGEGVQAGTALLYYVFAYAVMILGAFGVVSLLEKRSETSLQVQDLKGLAYKNPVIAFSLTVFLLSLAGIPPLVGFFSKVFVFFAMANEQMWWLLFWALLSAALGMYYYLRPLVMMYMLKEEEETAPYSCSGKWSSLVVAICVSLVLFVGVFSQVLYSHIEQMMKFLF